MSNHTYEKTRARLLEDITDEWQPRRYVVPTVQPMSYLDLLDEGVAEEKVEREHGTKVYYVRRRPAGGEK